MASNELWSRFKKYLCAPSGLGVRVDPSRLDFDEGFLSRMAAPMERAFDAMDELERGGIANPDENRRVGHYWLRDPDRAPSPQIAAEIRETVDAIERFAHEIHTGVIRPPQAERFENLLLIGIGGSALGPQLVSEALVDHGASHRVGLRSFFLDNTDPDGIEQCLARIANETSAGLAGTLAVVISKSGSTPEPRNGMLEAAAAYERAGLLFASHAVAITMEGSKLDGLARQSIDSWLRVFPMWDWVGGRTSETSAVGLLPAALEGIDIRALLEGARQMDEATRVRDPLRNPAALLAMTWHHAGEGRGARDLVILPYKDRLLLLSRYLQQLVMESLGKREDLDGNVVNQGLAVYGNKGSTDQHAYVQQLRDGLANFFVTFIQVLEDGGHAIEVDPGITAGDYLLGFYLGTRRALLEADRGSVSIAIRNVDASSLGKLIALFERAVGLYASLVNINAYHQPGVEAGKRAAAEVLEVQRQVLEDLEAHRGQLRDAETIAASAGLADEVETVYHILEHRAANARPDDLRCEEGGSPLESRYGIV